MTLDELEKEAFRARARAEGRSLSDWLRQVGRERLERTRPARLCLNTPDRLEAFFAECDAREVGSEPDWPEHRIVASVSRREGADAT